MRQRSYVSYQWLTSPRFLLPALVPNATLIEASPHDDPATLLESLEEATGWFHFHLNCTRTARFPLRRGELLELLGQKGIRAVNPRVTDISKRMVQQTCATAGLNSTAAIREGDPDERLIVKTDLNFGGDSEWALSSEDRAALGVGEGSSVMWKPNDYRILSRGEVADSWWLDGTLVFERFVENREHRWYRVFLYFSRMVVCEFVDPSEIKKVGHSSLARTWLVDLPNAAEAVHEESPRRVVQDVERFAGRFEIDFGAIDLVVDDEGAPYVIDVNTTPAYNYPVEGLVDYLRGGLPAPPLSTGSGAGEPPGPPDE